MPANALHHKECSNPGCKKRYTIIEAVNYFNDRMKCYVCRFCGSELMDMPNHNDEEEDIQAMQNKIKDQMEAETPFHSSILGYIKRLNGKQIHSVDPAISIENELRDASVGVPLRYSVECREWAYPFTGAAMAEAEAVGREVREGRGVEA